ncbi:MAG: hypothetical protein IJL52_05340 [Clostridia bacterium]|nr:hypothetical protein [Clostridia bacterium]
MDRIVSHGLKLDLHIHSSTSAPKDGKRVKNNTIENIPLLINKLDKCGVNICAITDHDAFSFEMYCALKRAELDTSSIQKVLPGVEFSVFFLDSEGTEQTIHVITVFSDHDNDKLRRIETVLDKFRPEDKGAYSEETFLKVLRDINLDTILVAHQKNSLSSKKPRKNDVNYLGETRFLELVASDYFEAYEFKNKRNEILNKNYLLTKGIDEKVRFVTGTDCHDWKVYPREDASDSATDFPYTYAKCLPTFRGLVMALTDRRRLKRVDSFFNPDKTTLEYIEIENNGEKDRIPLSKGINVIIGDNSIGKSMLLHALSGFEKSGEKLKKTIKDGYKTYLEKKNLTIKKQLKAETIFAFDMQGEVRRKFEQNKLVASEFSKYFPSKVNPQPYKSQINNEIDRLVGFLEEKFKYDTNVKELNTFNICVDEDIPESLSFIGNLRKTKRSVSEIEAIISAIKQLQVDYSFLTQQSIDEEDQVVLRRHVNTLNRMLEKYENRKERIEKENNRIETVATVIDATARNHTRSISDRQKRSTAFFEKTTLLKDSLKEIIAQERSIKPYVPAIDERPIEPNTNTIQDYCFVARLDTAAISSEFFLQHVDGLFKSNKTVDLNTITEKEMKDSLLKYDESPVLQYFREALEKSFENDFSQKQTIILKESDKAEELSAGLNAKIYFDLLSYENSIDGIYIIDQPEDNVSQPAIKEYLLDCFKTMGENRQVIMVSHNPQFIVNLDVDNIIYLFSENDGKLKFQSGALEYECPEYSVLQLVADNIDGGLDSIQKRWKRYEKNNRV